MRSEKDVRAGDIFATADGQLRKVVRVVRDGDRSRVHYQHKSATLPGRPFLFAHSPSDAPLMEDFVAQCARRLARPELDPLRDSGVLLWHE